jgi:hypothetical protein
MNKPHFRFLSPDAERVFLHLLFIIRKVASSMPDEMIFFLNYLIHPGALGPVVYKTSNRNEYQKNKHNDSGE